MSIPYLDDKPIIYCLEGVWRQAPSDGREKADYRTSDYSLKPFLELLEVLELWDTRHRDVATVSELKYYLQNEWKHSRPNSILYISTHGWSEGIELSPGNDIYFVPTDSSNGKVSIATLLKPLNKTRYHVHFGGCAVMEDHYTWARDFRKLSGATVVSGFRSDNIGWIDMELPGVIAELMMFGALSDSKIKYGGQYKDKLKSIRIELRKRFPDCDLIFSSDQYTSRFVHR